MAAATVGLACAPTIGPVQTVATAAQRAAAARAATPSLVDIFAWPDGPLGVLRDGPHDRFFATDGGQHRNGKAGSVTETIGDLDDPLGITRSRIAPQPLDAGRVASPPDIAARPLDVTIQPDLALDARSKRSRIANRRTDSRGAESSRSSRTRRATGSSRERSARASTRTSSADRSSCSTRSAPTGRPRRCAAFPLPVADEIPTTPRRVTSSEAT